MTVLKLSTQYYDVYSNSSLRSVDTAAYAKKNYNVKNLSGSLGVVASARSQSFATLQNVDTFVKNGFSVSSGTATNLLSGGTGMSPLYGLIGTQLSMAAEQVNKLFSSEVSSAISGYASYLDTASGGSLLDITA